MVIGNFLILPDDLQQQYVPYAPPFVQRGYRRRHDTLSYDRATTVRSHSRGAVVAGEMVTLGPATAHQSNARFPLGHISMPP